MSTISQPIVITGAGLVTSLGLDRETTWQAIEQGRCGIGPLTAIESPLEPDKEGGQAPELPRDFAPGKSREVRYLKLAIDEAMRHARIAECLPYSAHRCGVVLGTTLHGMRSAGEFLRSNNPKSLRNFLAAATLRQATENLGMEGLAATTCSACSSGLGSIALAITLLQSGQLDLVVSGGYDALSEYAYGGFNSLRLVAEGPLRPFARNREGMKLAEGYGIVILERADDAERRAAKSLVRILGWGESSDAHHLTQPHPHGDGASRAMKTALDSAGMQPSDIDLIVAHATGTPDNDAGEFAALANVFDERLSDTPVVAFKSQLGHTLGGAGAAELILSAMAMNRQMIPACANVKHEDIEFNGLQLATGQARGGKIRTTLNTSLGFGGANTCLILGAPFAAEAAECPVQSKCFTDIVVGTRLVSPCIFDDKNQEGETSLAPTKDDLNRAAGSPCHAVRDVLITGIGVVLPGAIGNEAFAQLLARDGAKPIDRDTGPIAESDIAHLLNSRRVRRMSDYVKLSLAATTLACRDAGLDDLGRFGESCSAMLGTAHGSANFSGAYYRQIVNEGINAANPILFAEGVPNAASAHLSLMLSLKGSCQTIIGSRTAALDALRLAALRIAQGRCDCAIVGAAEEYDHTVNIGYKHCGLYRGLAGGSAFSGAGGFVCGSGAVTLILESGESARARQAKARGIVRDAAGGASTLRRVRKLAQRIWADLGFPSFVMGSANGTWIDRIEFAGMRRTDDSPLRAPAPVVSSLYGHIAETFSVGPLASIAAILLAKRMPAFCGQGAKLPRGLQSAKGNEQPDTFGVLCTDYMGQISGARIEVVS